MKFIIWLTFNLLSCSTFAFCSLEEAEIAVRKACELYIQKGEKAFNELIDYRFCDDKNNYVWAQRIDPAKKKVVIAFHPISPGLTGRDMLKGQQKELTDFFRKLDDTLRASTTTKSNFIEYQWKKPGEISPSKKKSVMIRCNNVLGFGGGFWVND